MVGPPLCYVVDWLPPEFGAVGQYAVARCRQFAASGRKVYLIGLTSGPAGIAREEFPTGGVLEIRRVRAIKYDKSRYYERILWTLRTNLRLVREATRVPDISESELIFTGAPPFMLFFCVGVRRLLGQRIVYRITDFYPEVIIAEAGPHWSLRMFARLTWWFRRRVDAFEALGEDQRMLLLKGGIPNERIKLERDPSPVAITGREAPLNVPTELRGRKILLYSGNFGVAHEADTIVEALVRHHRDGRGQFGLWLNATGRRADETERRLRAAGVPIHRTTPGSLDELPRLVATADIHLITLRPQFSGIVLPSKVYACIASRRPILFVGPTSSDVHLLCTRAIDVAYFQVNVGDVQACTEVLERLTEMQPARSTGRALAVSDERDG